MDETIPTCDVLLFVTTSTEEEQLKFVVTQLSQEHETLCWENRTHNIYGQYIWLGSLGSSKIIALKTRMGALRYRGAAWEAVMFKTLTGASGLIAVGMAFGTFPDNQMLGDVLVATHILPYDNRRKYISEKDLPCTEYKEKPRPCSAPLRKMLERYNQQGPLGFEVHFGPLLSGGAKIESRLYRDDLVRDFTHQHRKVAVGGDMEGVALVTASDPQFPSWIVVKGISDFADEDQPEVVQGARVRACRNAIQFVMGALAQKG